LCGALAVPMNRACCRRQRVPASWQSVGTTIVCGPSASRRLGPSRCGAAGAVALVDVCAVRRSCRSWPLRAVASCRRGSCLRPIGGPGPSLGGYSSAPAGTLGRFVACCARPVGADAGCPAAAAELPPAHRHGDTVCIPSLVPAGPAVGPAGGRRPLRRGCRSLGPVAPPAGCTVGIGGGWERQGAPSK